MLKRIFNRNRKGFFRKPKSKQNKKKISKYNKLNISNDETNMNTYSFIESGPSIEDDEDEIDLPKLNFTCILNNPLEDNNNASLFGQLLSRFQEDQKIVTEEERMKKEGHKFDLIDIIQDEMKYNNTLNYESKVMKKIGKIEEEEEEELDDILNDLEQLENLFSSKKTLEQCIKETNQELFKDKKTFKLKKFLDLSYNNYIAKIKHNYLIYRDNQKKNIIKNIKFEENILSIEGIKLENQEQILNKINEYRKSLNISMNLIETDYKIDSKDFKMRDELLDLEIDKILEMIQKLIEQKGIIELEAEKSNINYDLIKYYFINNYPLALSQVDNMQFKVNNLVDKKNMLKNKFISLSQRMMLLKIKRQNLVKLLNIHKLMLNADCDKIDNIKELLYIREAKQKLKQIPDFGINIIQKIDEELTKREMNITTDDLNKITTLIKNEINNCFNIEVHTNAEDENNQEIIDIKNKYNYQYYNMDKNIFEQIIQYKNHIQEKINDYIILVINSIDEEFLKKKIYHYLELSEDKEEYMNKVYATILSSIEEVILTNLGKILQLKNMNEILYLFYIGKMCQFLLDSINKFLEEKDKEKLINDINNKLHDIIDKNLLSIFDDVQNDKLSLNNFVIKNKIIKGVYNKIPILLENKNFMEKVENYEFNFNENFWKGKCEIIKGELNEDNLKCLDDISYDYQKLVDIIFSFNKDSFNINEEKKYENLKHNILLNIELTLNESDIKEINVIEITKIYEGKTIQKKYKLISSVLEIIIRAVSTIKLLLFFNEKNYSKILLYFHEILLNYLNLSNDIVLETKGQIKNITQNELASSYSSINLIHEIILQFISFINSDNSIEEEVNNKYKELGTLSSEFLQKNLLNLNNMIKEGIYESSINEFKNILSLENYPIVKGSLPINPFAQNLVKLVKNVYKSLKHCYEDENISKIILDNLNIFNEELEKLMENKKELNGEEKKQFKKDFTFIRKNIDTGIEDIDFKGFKKKLIAIQKKWDDKEKEK